MDDRPDEVRVLVVDDEPSIVDVISMALRYQGFGVEAAVTGQEALEQVRRWRPHVIVLDVMLPDMTGFDVARRLSAEHAAVPILFLIAQDSTAEKVCGLTTGGDDYVTKPFSLEEMIARLRNILRRTGTIREMSSRVISPTSSSTRTRSIMSETQKLDLASDRPMRILVVHPQVGSEVGRLLARDGHDVLEVGSEDRPRRMLGVFVPDLILILCPEPARVCRELREAAPEVAIVALVSGREVADRVTVLDAGADDCLAMPYHDAELRARLWAVTRHRAPRARQRRDHPVTLGDRR